MIAGLRKFLSITIYNIHSSILGQLCTIDDCEDCFEQFETLSQIINL